MTKRTQSLLLPLPQEETEGRKKPCGSALDEAKDLDRRLKHLQERRDVLTVEANQRVEKKWKRFRDADSTQTMLYNAAYSARDWCCLVCARDYTPMLMTDVGASAATFLYHCEQCGGAVCFRCQLRLLTLNRHCDRSVGAHCPTCRFYNCNLVSMSQRAAKPSLSEMPFPSGYSTLVPGLSKGERMVTSAAVLGDDFHRENTKMRADMFEILVMDYDEGQVSSDDDDDEYTGYSSPGSPLH